MRDPMSWAIPLFRAFGIPVKVHLFFFIITLGFFIRQVTDEGNIVWWGDILLFTVFLLFGVILLHEFGHCFGGRWVGGEANEILIWPLGGLAYVDVPHNWKAHTITAAAGPAVNVVLCVLCALILAVFGFLPSLNPLPTQNNPYVSEMTNYRDGRVYTSSYGLRLYRPGTAEEVHSSELSSKLGNPTELNDAIIKTNGAVERAKAPTALVWVNRTFWLSWILLLFNLIPAYPLDGGQILQGFIWSRTGYRQATQIAAYVGFGVAVIFMIASIAVNEVLLMGLSLFMLYSCWTRLHALEVEEGIYGDFSQGYTSLEMGDDPPPRRPRKGNFIKRWLQARAARRLQREIEERQQEDERMDQLLDKIARYGKEALTDEEQRFMARVSERYRNRS